MTSKMSQTLFLLYHPEPARPMSKTKPVGAHSICARGSLSCRKRARADMESAPTFFVASAHRAEAAPRVEFSLFVENGIRRGAFYMRPPKFILPQAGTGGYGIRPYVFVAAEPPRGGGAPREVFSLWSKARSVGAHSICARRSLSYHKRAWVDMESAPTFFVAGGVPRTEAVPRVQFSPFVESEIRRGAFYMRPRRFILPQAGTGGYGIRPYVFCGGQSHRTEAAKGRVFAYCACKRIYFVIFYNSQFTKKWPPVVKHKQAVLQIF